MRGRIALIIASLFAAPIPVQAEGGDQVTRSFVDLPESSATACPCTHVIYFVPSDGVDRSLDINGTLSGSLRSLRAWFSNQMSMAPRIDRVPGGDLFDITFVRGREKASYYSSLSQLTTELESRGFADARKRYVTYAGLNRGSTCGESTFGYPGIEGPTHAISYLDSSGCKSSSFGQGSAASASQAETVVAHEWLHADGFVMPTAPRHCPTSLHHVCTAGLYLTSGVTGVVDPEQVDVMFPWIDAKLSQKTLDSGRNDYLDHGIPGVPDLRMSPFLEPA